MLIETSKAGEFGCHVTRAWPPPETPEKTPSRMCAGRRCAAWVVRLVPGKIALFDSHGARPGQYVATTEIGTCGLLHPTHPEAELSVRRDELVALGAIRFEPRPPPPPMPMPRNNTVLSGRPDHI